MSVIDKIKSALSRVTPGEWEDSDGVIYGYRDGDSVMVCDVACDPTAALSEEDIANTELITLAKNNMTTLMRGIDVLKAAQADLERILPEIDTSGDLQHSGWKTLEEINMVLATLGGDLESERTVCLRAVLQADIEIDEQYPVAELAEIDATMREYVVNASGDGLFTGSTDAEFDHAHVNTLTFANVSAERIAERLAGLPEPLSAAGLVRYGLMTEPSFIAEMSRDGDGPDSRLMIELVAFYQTNGEDISELKNNLFDILDRAVLNGVITSRTEATISNVTIGVEQALVPDSPEEDAFLSQAVEVVAEQVAIGQFTPERVVEISMLSPSDFAKEVSQRFDARFGMVQGAYTSVWDGGVEVTTDCRINLKTGEVSADPAEEVSADNLNSLDDQYVTFKGCDFKVHSAEFDTEVIDLIELRNHVEAMTGPRQAQRNLSL